MDIHLSEASGVPFYRQLEDQVADRIRAGLLAPGDALPSVRQLAATLMISVITVKRAYSELEAAGLVVSRQGRGTFVAEAAPAASRQQLLADLSGEVEAVVERAATLEVGADTLREAFFAALERHYPEEP